MPWTQRIRKGAGQGADCLRRILFPEIYSLAKSGTALFPQMKIDVARVVLVGTVVVIVTNVFLVVIPKHNTGQVLLTAEHST